MACFCLSVQLKGMWNSQILRWVSKDGLFSPEYPMKEDVEQSIFEVSQKILYFHFSGFIVLKQVVLNGFQLRFKLTNCLFFSSWQWQEFNQCQCFKWSANPIEWDTDVRQHPKKKLIWMASTGPWGRFHSFVLYITSNFTGPPVQWKKRGWFNTFQGFHVIGTLRLMRTGKNFCISTCLLILLCSQTCKVFAASVWIMIDFDNGLPPIGT